MRFLMLNWRDPLDPRAGGAERVTLAFLRGLRDRGHEVHWHSFAYPGSARSRSSEGMWFHTAGGVLTAQWAAWRWYRRQPAFDLVIDQHHGIPWYAPWWCRTRCLGYIHEVLGPIWRSFYRWPTSQWGPWQERWTHWCYRRVPFWVPSESTRQALMRHGVREVHVLPNGVDLEPLPGLPSLVLDRPLRLIVVSRLAPNKRVDHALGCLAELRRRGVAAVLTVIGNGMAAGSLRQQAMALGLGASVTFAGYQEEAAKAAALKESHVLLHPSVREGWGLNVIEANAMGCPAAVYPVDGLVDSTVHQVTGCVAARETPAALADAVQWMMADGDRYQAIREAAWRRASEFRWGAVIPVVCGFLESQASREKMVFDTRNRGA